LAAALTAAVGESPHTLAARGERGREYVVRNFGWTDLSRRVAAAYSWAAGILPPSADIVFD